MACPFITGIATSPGQFFGENGGSKGWGGDRQGYFCAHTWPGTTASSEPLPKRASNTVKNIIAITSLVQIITMEKDGEVPTTKVEWGSAQSTAAPQGPPSSYGGGYAQAGYQQHQQQQQQQPNYYGGGGGGGASAQGERRSVVIPVASGPNASDLFSTYSLLNTHDIFVPLQVWWGP
jgi:hypothetical protein